MLNLMAKRLSMKSRKGFTLVELMIVIAIIGVLAIVLIPQASKMRANARLSGVESNMRVVQAQLEGVIGDVTTEAELASTLKARLGDMVKNPIISGSKSTDVNILSSTDIADNSAVTIISNSYTAKTGAGGTDSIFSTSGSLVDPELAGTVVVATYNNGTKISAAIYGFDASGKPITSPTKAIEVTQ